MNQRSRFFRKTEEKRIARQFLFLFLGSLLFWFAAWMLCGNVKTAKAASASISIQSKNSKVYVGDTVYIIITLSSSDAIKGFEGYFTYDNRYLRFERGGSVVHGNDDAFRILDMERTSSATKIKYSVKFTARRAGSTTIALKKPYNVLADDDNSTRMSISYSALNIVVADAEKQTKSPASQAPADKPDVSEKPPEKVKEPKKDIEGSSRLRSLQVGGTQLTPDFSPDIKKYSGMISTSEDKLNLTYETEDSDAKVTVKGNSELKDGKNIIKIIVKSTKGGKTTYRLSMTVNKTPSDQENQNGQVTITEKAGTLYLTGTTSIQIGKPEREEEIPEGFQLITQKIGDRQIECYALDGDTQAGYVLLYGTEEKIFYLYDRKAGSLLPYEKVKNWYRSEMEEEDSDQANQEDTIQSYRYVLGIMGAFCALMLLMMLYFGLHSRHSRE